MATTYYADNFRTPFPDTPAIGAVITREFQFTITAALIINDLIKLCPISVGPGIVLLSYFIDVPDLDSNGTPLVTLDLGDNASAARYIAAATVGQAAGYLTPAVNGVAGSLPAYYTTVDEALVLKVHAAPATSATSGAIKGWAQFINVTSQTPFTAITT